MKKGKLIVIEGIDGSGKATQANLLRDAMVRNGHPAVVVSFPGYDTTIAGKEIRAYLDGRYGDLSPRLAALLYAVDRFEQLPELQARMDEGRNVICDRYLASNLAHQGARTKHPAELMEWIKLVETKVFGVLEPDLSILLSVPVQQSQAMMADRVADKHEEDVDHLILAHSIYEELANEPEWVRVECMEFKTLYEADCVDDSYPASRLSSMRSVDAIAKMVRDVVESKLGMVLE